MAKVDKRPRYTGGSCGNATESDRHASRAPVPHVAAPAAEVSLTSQLLQLADLKTKGALSEEEYVVAKGKLLG
jgi:hypothetical protein